MMHYGYGFMGFGWLSQIIIIILFFLIVWWMIKGSSMFGCGCKRNETALDILKRRLVKGELDQKEYEKLKKEIEKD